MEDERAYESAQYRGNKDWRIGKVCGEKTYLIKKYVQGHGAANKCLHYRSISNAAALIQSPRKDRLLSVKPADGGAARYKRLP
jgi:hypothetical protein